jgi:hypothetical protein
MLREIIFYVVSGGVIGIAIGSLVLRNSRLTLAVLRFLRLGLWLPFLIIFAVREDFILGILAVMLCTVYHYLAARFLLSLQGREIWRHVGREAILQAFFISLISQIPAGYWKWFEFAAMFQPAIGLRVLLMLLIFLFFINWIFRSNFDLAARARATILTRELNSATWCSLCGAILVTAVCLLVWQAFAQPLHFISTSPLDTLKAGYYLLKHHETWNDIRVSLL